MNVFKLKFPVCQPRVLLRVRCYKHLFPQFNQFEPVIGWLNTDSIALAKSHVMSGSNLE